MNKIILTIVFLAAAFGTATAQKSVAAEREVEFQSYNKLRYFERNDSGLKGNSSYLVFTSLEKFEQIFGYAAINGENFFLPENVFDSKLVIAMIKRGNSRYEYDLKKVTVRKKELYVWYNTAPEKSSTVAAKPGNDSSSWTTPSFLTVDKNNYTKVVFMENGKRVGTAIIPDINTEEIVYQFQDAPVSPEYQRSFKVSLNKTEAKLSFHPYRKDPKEKTVKPGDAKFNEIMELARKLKIRKGGTKENDGCTGGTSESLKILDAKKIETFNASVFHCGGTDYGDLIGDIKSIKTKITALFPNFEENFKQ